SLAGVARRYQRLNRLSRASLGREAQPPGQQGAPVQIFTKIMPSVSFKLQNGLLIINKQFQA
ncbi:hypothetical protein A2U01_0117540, partial [Trifolium medium]|nr:hypothetical protein [Trifolium medium]